MSKNEEKIGSKLSNKEKLMFAGGALCSALLIVGSYKVGCELSLLKIETGLNKCFSMDPEIESRMIKALTKLTEK